MRRSSAVLAAALLVALAGCLLVAARGRAAAWLLESLEAELGAAVSFGALDVGALALAPTLPVAVTDLDIRSASAQPGAPTLSAARATAQVEVASLVSPGPLRVRGLVLEQARVRLSVDRAGRVGWRPLPSEPVPALERAVRWSADDVLLRDAALSYQHAGQVVRLDLDALLLSARAEPGGHRLRLQADRVSLSDGGYTVLEGASLEGALSLRGGALGEVELRVDGHPAAATGTLFDPLALAIDLPAASVPAVQQRGDLSAGRSGRVRMTVEGSPERPRLRLVPTP